MGTYLSIAPPSKSIMNLKNPKAHHAAVAQYAIKRYFPFWMVAIYAMIKPYEIVK